MVRRMAEMLGEPDVTLWIGVGLAAVAAVVGGAVVAFILPLMAGRKLITKKQPASKTKAEETSLDEDVR